MSGAVLGLGFGRVVAQPPSAAVVAESTTVDGLAAVLGGADPLEPTRTILQSDVELRARISLLGLGNERALFGELPRSLLRATLDELIGEHLIAIEAERVKITPPSPVDVQRELIEVEREAGGQHWLARLTSWLGATDSELTQLAERRALIGAFLRANLEGVSVVTDAEVDARLRDDWASYIAESPESARVTVRAILAKDALRRTIEHWVRVLRARTRVRVFAAYEAS
ncbi:MAG: hypothetical protein ABW321_06590 [Polyangiales bacterium]